MPGDLLTFERISVQDAQRLARDRRRALLETPLDSVGAAASLHRYTLAVGGRVVTVELGQFASADRLRTVQASLDGIPVRLEVESIEG